jgi:hypothetical protein
MKNFFARLSRILLVGTFILAIAWPKNVYANNNPETKKDKQIKAYILNNKTKEKFELPVVETIDETGNMLTYVVLVPTSYLSESHSRLDASYSVRLTITQYFNQKTIGSYQYVDLQKSSAKWEKLDSQVTITNAKIRSGVYGYTEAGRILNKSETKTIGTPTSNTWYSQIPSWKGTYVRVTGLDYQATYAENTIVRGGSSWSLGFCVSQGGGDWGDCE